MGSLSNKKMRKKIDTIDPRFREKIDELFETIYESISTLYEAAIHDEKTKLYNSKFFETILEMEIEKAKRKEQDLSLLIIDIDYFKKINDTYGHLKADELLIILAKLLKAKARKSDIVSRFGGEEFFILLPETNIAKAKKFASRLKKSISEERTLKKYNVTVSGGITEYKLRDNKKKFKERADKAMYQAKKKGRNRFEVLD